MEQSPNFIEVEKLTYDKEHNIVIKKEMVKVSCIQTGVRDWHKTKLENDFTDRPIIVVPMVQDREGAKHPYTLKVVSTLEAFMDKLGGNVIRLNS